VPEGATPRVGIGVTETVRDRGREHLRALLCLQRSHLGHEHVVAEQQVVVVERVLLDVRVQLRGDGVAQ